MARRAAKRQAKATPAPAKAPAKAAPKQQEHLSLQEKLKARKAGLRSEAAMERRAARRTEAAAAAARSAADAPAAASDEPESSKKNQVVEAPQSERAPRSAEAIARRAAKRACLLYTSPSPRDATLSRMPSSA